MTSEGQRPQTPTGIKVNWMELINVKRNVQFERHGARRALTIMEGDTGASGPQSTSLFSRAAIRACISVWGNSLQPPETRSRCMGRGLPRDFLRDSLLLLIGTHTSRRKGSVRPVTNRGWEMGGPTKPSVRKRAIHKSSTRETPVTSGIVATNPDMCSPHR